MDGLTIILAGLLRWVVVLLPAGRREWGEAVWAEAGDLPAGRVRLAWVVGGLWVVIREAEVIRKIGYTVAGVAAGATMVWLDWHAGSSNPAVPTNRLALIGIVLLLVVLPWAVRPVFGPVADNRVARVVRAAGYIGVYLVLLVLVGLSRFAGRRFDHFRAFDQANWEADMRAGAVVSALVLIAVVGGYAVAILAITARRTSVAPTTLAIGAQLGVAAALIMYALMPLGNTLHPDNTVLAASYRIALLLAPPIALLAAGTLAGRRITSGRATPSPADDQVTDAERYAVHFRQGCLAGLCAGGTAALLLSIITIATMLLLPRHVDLKWANPDPAVAHGTTFEVQMSVGDAALKYQLGLLLGPLIGLALGAVAGAGVAGRREAQRPADSKSVATP
jgi:hypothetical protein